MPDTISGASDSALIGIVDQLKGVLAANAATYPMITAAMKTDLDLVGR